MRDFIKNHTPEWWDVWCWFGLVMLGWSIGWAVFGSNPMARGFQIGVAIYWVGFLVYRANNWYSEQLIDMYRDVDDAKDAIIRHQQSMLIIKNETIKVQQDRIDHLQEQRAAR